MKTLPASLRYLRSIMRHKAFVFRAGLITGAPLWRLVIHDISKLTPAEFPHYRRRFLQGNPDPEGFRRAWLHHYSANGHHWEHWCLSGSHTACTLPKTDFVPMPDWAVREMIADWYGATRAASGAWPRRGRWDWVDANLPGILARMDADTGERIRALIDATIDDLPRRRLSVVDREPALPAGDTTLA